MASELALLPMWYAEEGSAVLAPSAYNLDYVKKIQELLGLSVDLITEPELAIEQDWIFVPGDGMWLYGSGFLCWVWMKSCCLLWGN